MGTREEVATVAKAAALAVLKHLDRNPRVKLVGVRRPLRPEEILEREEEKIERRKHGLKPGAHIRPPLTWEEKQKVQELKARGFSISEIAKGMGLAKTTVWNAYHQTHPPLRRAITTERLEEVKDLRRQGLSYAEIGRRIGHTRWYVRYLFHRAGEKIDLEKAAKDLHKSMMETAEATRRTVTVDEISSAAERLREIGEDAQLLLEISPKVPLMPEYYPEHPYNVGFRATWAEEVLRTGVWCDQQREQSYDIKELKLDRVEEREVTHTAEKKKLLATCTETAKEVATGYLENKPGYEAKMAQIAAITEEMMEEVKG